MNVYQKSDLLFDKISCMGKLQPLISIIIPCYNSGKFVANTIEMLLKQNISGCEFILINDGSTDNTLEILKRYESDENIRIINQPNQGVSVARNEGMRIAQGKYIYFLDSDDTLADGTLSHFKKILTAHPNCQIYAFGYETKVKGKTNKRYVFPRYDSQTLSGQEIMRSFLSKKLCIHICSGIYERQFLFDHQLKFKPGVKIGEDVLFILQALQQADQVYYSKQLTFIYQIRDDSAMQGYKSYSMKLYNSQLLLQDFLLPLSVQHKSLSRFVNFFLLFSYISNLRHYLKSSIKDKELNKLFIRDGNIRYKKNFTGNIVLYLAMKTTMFIPIKLILKILKS